MPTLEHDLREWKASWAFEDGYTHQAQWEALLQQVRKLETAWAIVKQRNDEIAHMMGYRPLE